jgi:phosphoenolpyruvate-protein kinase (PTS system EI component)
VKVSQGVARGKIAPMSADEEQQQVDRIRDQTRDMERDEKRLESRLEDLESDIGEAKSEAEHRSRDLDATEAAGDMSSKPRTDEDPSGAGAD